MGAWSTDKVINHPLIQFECEWGVWGLVPANPSYATGGQPQVLISACRIRRSVKSYYTSPGFSFSSGSLHEGDEIAEINGKSVTNHTVDQLQKILVSWYLITQTIILALKSAWIFMQLLHLHNQIWVKLCHLYIQKETNGVVTMKIIPNLQSRSRACEVMTWQHALRFGLVVHIAFVLSEIYVS